MTTSDFHKWLRTHYPRGANINRVTFLATFNAASSLYGAGRITESTLNNWLHRQPPDEWAGMPFTKFLESLSGIEVMKIAKIYRIDVPVDARQMKALEAIGAQGTGVEDFLLCTLLAAIEDEVEIFENSQRKKKRKESKSATPSEMAD